MGAKVVMVGLDPDVVDFSDPAYAAFPGLNASVLRDALEKDRQALVSEGFDAVYSFWDKSERSTNSSKIWRTTVLTR